MANRKPRTWTWKNARLSKQTAEKLQVGFEIGLFESILQSEPENVPALMQLGQLYAQTGRVNQGLEVDLRLVKLQPREPIHHYNLACAHSLLGHIDPAFQALTQAVQLGYNKLEHLRDDPDLANLKQDGRYEVLVRQLQGGEQS